MPNLSCRLKRLIISTYLFNEWRGWTQLERELLPRLRAKPDCDSALIQGVKKHAADEKRHYRMFVNYFSANKWRPFALGLSIGHFDILSFCLVPKNTSDLNKSDFAKLCRAIILTEHRGMLELDYLLKQKFICRDGHLFRILRIIQRDEPSHIHPYEEWLKSNGLRGPSWLDKMVDRLIHYAIVAIIIPAHFLNPWLQAVDVEGRHTTGYSNR